jgi:RNase P subunit RPR2
MACWDEIKYCSKCYDSSDGKVEKTVHSAEREDDYITWHCDECGEFSDDYVNPHDFEPPLEKDG